MIKTSEWSVRETKRYLSQDNQSPDQDFNTEPTRCEVGMVIIRPILQCSVSVYNIFFNLSVPAAMLLHLKIN
jgi:hypothetical protein